MEEKKDMKKKMKENEKDVKHKTKSIHVHIDQELAYHAIVIHIHMCGTALVPVWRSCASDCGPVCCKVGRNAVS